MFCTRVPILRACCIATSSHALLAEEKHLVCVRVMPRPHSSWADVPILQSQFSVCKYHLTNAMRPQTLWLFGLAQLRNSHLRQTRRSIFWVFHACNWNSTCSWSPTSVQSTQSHLGSIPVRRVLLKGEHGKLLNWNGWGMMACGLVIGDTYSLQYTEQCCVASSP